MASSELKYQAGTHSAAFVTCPDDETAKKLAHKIIGEKLAACVNIIPKITSVYEWEGKINEDAEVLLMIKTRFVCENQSYKS
jgi:periplasmic divalent cation tolerance protein